MTSPYRERNRAPVPNVVPGEPQYDVVSESHTALFRCDTCTTLHAINVRSEQEFNEQLGTRGVGYTPVLANESHELRIRCKRCGSSLQIQSKTLDKLIELRTLVLKLHEDCRG